MLKALKVLFERATLEQRINSIQDKLDAIASEITILKLDAAENIIAMVNLDKLRKLKAIKQRLSQKSCAYKRCFHGSKNADEI